MKKITFKQLFIATMVMGAVVTGCKKEEVASPSASSTSSAPTAAQISAQSQSAADLTSVETQSDESMDDVNSVLENSSMRSISGPCNATIDTSAKATGLITIDYNGLSCDLKKVLSGSISIQLPSSNGNISKWSDTGVTIGITYNNFKVTNVADSNSITFNGGYSVTNVTGGNVFLLASGDSVVHKVRGDIQITFSDSTTRTWGVSKTRTFYNDGGLLNIFASLSIKVTGDTTINGYSNVSRWGTNRAGEDFTVSITTPITIKSAGSLCIFKQMTGEQVYRRGGATLTITHGVDANGNVVASGTCSYGYKLSWTDSQGNQGEAIRMYLF